MSDQDQSKLARIQSVLTALLKHQMNDSLARLHAGLERWRTGELGPFEAHGAVVEHVARAKQLAARVAQIRPSGPAELLRDAFDVGLVSRDEFVSLVGSQPEDVAPASASDRELPDKRELVESLLEEGPILVHLDARADGVCVPEGYRGDPMLVLKFGYELSPPIHDLDIDEHGITGTLTFSRVPFRCEIPWSAMYAVMSEVDRHGMVWPEDVPESVLERMQAEAATADDPEPPDDGPGPGAPRGPTGDGAGKSRRPSYLKIVK